MLALTLILLSAADAGTAPNGLQCLCRHYACEAVSRDGGWSARLSDGGVIAWDDGQTKTFDVKLEKPDLEDTLSQRYEPGPIVPITTADQDPGRIRVDALFRATYGDSAKAVEHELIPFTFFGQSLRIHPKAKTAFERARTELEAAVKADPALKPFLEDAGGTFQWRVIAGTERISAHAYGVSIDINVKRSHYWRWDKKRVEWKNQIREPIVRAFERAGFIWGGRWYHYDTMHFEWRPELFDPDCR